MWEQQRGDKIAKVSQFEKEEFQSQHKDMLVLSSGSERSLKGVRVEGITPVLQNPGPGCKVR